MTTSYPGTPSPPETPVGQTRHDGPGPRPGPRPGGEQLRHLAALRRSRADKKVAGVAGGISRHLDVDPIITRVALVVLVFFGGAGLIVYTACWLLVPLEDRTRATVPLDERSRAVALLLAGLLATLSLLGDSLGSWSVPWPVFGLGLVIIAVLLLRGRNDGDPAAAASPAPSAPSWPGAQVPGAGSPYAGSSYPPPVAPPVAPPAGPSAVGVRRPRRPGPLLFWYSLALIAIGVGVLVGADLAGIDVAASAYPALAVVVCGLALVVGAFWGRPGGLIALGLVSALATAGTAAAADLAVGQVLRVPATSASLEATYDLDVGEIVLDLRDLVDPGALDGRTVDLGVDVGRVEVIVPDDVDLVVRTDLGTGDSTVLGRSGDGGRDTYSVAAAVDTGAGAGAGVPNLTLDVRVGLGEIVITREEVTR